MVHEPDSYFFLNIKAIFQLILQKMAKIAPINAKDSGILTLYSRF